MPVFLKANLSGMKTKNVHFISKSKLKSALLRTLFLGIKIRIGIIVDSFVRIGIEIKFFGNSVSENGIKVDIIENRFPGTECESELRNRWVAIRIGIEIGILRPF